MPKSYVFRRMGESDILATLGDDLGSFMLTPKKKTVRVIAKNLSDNRRNEIPTMRSLSFSSP
jgi:hypothetical protein